IQIIAIEAGYHLGADAAEQLIGSQLDRLREIGSYAGQFFLKFSRHCGLQFLITSALVPLVQWFEVYYVENDVHRLGIAAYVSTSYASVIAFDLGKDLH